MIKRLIDFYCLSCGDRGSYMSSIWKEIYSAKYANLGDALLAKNEDEVKDILDHLISRDRLAGLGIHVVTSKELDEILVYIARMLGTIPHPNPEQPVEYEIADINFISSEIEKQIGVRLWIPECLGFKMECCLPHAFLRYVIQWIIITQKCGVSKSIFEIGGGIGFLGLIAHSKGVQHYTSLDLPIMTVCSAYFASHYCAPDKIWLHGEPENKDAFVRYYPCTDYKQITEDQIRFDVAFNSDSFPEIPDHIQDDYLNLMLSILKPSGSFISINHESNRAFQRRVYDACTSNGNFILKSRELWPFREGYVVERWDPMTKLT